MTSERVPTAVSADEFLRNLADSGLSVVDDARTAAAATSAEAGSVVADRLVADGVLTAFQAEAVLGRRFADLRMGNYEILDRLGAGGMGTVFKARHRRMKRVVALKLLSKEVAQSATFTQRFQREVETIAKLNHPNVVMAFDADEAEEGPFLIMEFVDGRDLASEVARGPLSVADSVNCLIQAGRGLESAHALGIVHRDIKPGNLMRDAAGVVKVADLGLARLSGPAGGHSDNSALTQAGGIVGTLDYMAPEQALDSTTVDARVDIYSLGCTLFFLLAGRPPYQAGSLMALLLKHREAAIPSLREARPDVPPELDALFHRMVAKSPSDRFSTMTEVVSALDELARAVPLSDSRPQAAPLKNPTPDNTDQTCALDSANTSRIGDSRTTPPPSASTGLYVPSPDETGVYVPGSAGRPDPVAGRVVVLVEQSRTQAGIITRYLQQLGAAAVHVTKTGREALETAKRERANVILGSMHLADMTGVQLAQALLADPECDGIGFVLATSETDTHETGPVPISPRVVVMPKPFDVQRLKMAMAVVAK